ncbi:MAG: Xaa-Pro peptidase family protein [Natrialbaceae archaeon]|nr:Xaa-Pro peptidase family protein [Natrialbaceae archaeon]
MDIDLAPLREFLGQEGLDGYLIEADGEDSDQRYVSGFDAPDPFWTLVTPGQTLVLVSELEYGRARRAARADRVARHSDFDFQERIADRGSHEGRLDGLATFLEDEAVAAIGVPTDFPVGSADGLRERGIGVTVETGDIIGAIRAVKHPVEIEHIREAQRANEAAMRTAESLLATASVRDGTLYSEGEPLTSERITAAIEATLLEHRCALDETIVAAGADGADPHDRGSGPIPADEPVVVDIFPRHKETHYFADMTRTFVRGTPAPAVIERYQVIESALEAALETIEAGVEGRTVHDAACDVFEAAGYETLRSDPATETGFIHGTGHGVGLDIHESPRLAPAGEELEAGHVVTVEPGLYDPAVGGIRLEELVVVRADGYELLSDYPMELTPATR